MNREIKKLMMIELLKFSTFFSYSLGYELMDEMLRFFGKVQPTLSKERRRVVQKNFAMIRGTTLGWERTFVNYWSSVAEFLYLPYMNSYEILSKLKNVENIEILKYFKKLNKPLIVVTAHIGSPEVLANFAALLGFSGVAVAEVPSDGWFREFLRFRGRFGMRIIPLGKSFPILVDAIKNNEFVYLVSDRDVKKKGVAMPFGRGRKFFPTGFASLSIETKTPLVFACGIPMDGYYVGFISESYSPKSIFDALEWYSNILFKFVYDYTDRWFVFQDEWA